MVPLLVEQTARTAETRDESEDEDGGSSADDDAHENCEAEDKKFKTLFKIQNVLNAVDGETEIGYFADKGQCDQCL